MSEHDHPVRSLINARGCATLAGGTLMVPEAVQAYVSAAKRYVWIHELQAWAGQVISRCTHAESGYVTSGAAAGLTLSAAACIAGMDLEIMDALPNVDVVAHDILVQRVHRNPYDHAVRASGASLKICGSPEGTTVDEMSNAIDSNTVAAYFHAQRERVGLSFSTFAQIAKEFDLPVIVDASMNLPPAENLYRYVDEGADLVTFSGGKTIRGPQSTGFVAGTTSLIESMAIQHQDMDVRAETWSGRHLIEAEVLSRAPTHGIGRGLKVGKEDVAALIAALERYELLDHSAVFDSWLDTAHQLAQEISQIPGLLTSVEREDQNGRPVPAAVVTIDPSVFGMNAVSLVRRLAAHDPSVAVNDYMVDQDIIQLDPETLESSEIPRLVDILADIGRRNGP